eukprot:m.201441 g.201441  ORF g.201441 m.201441 type:complete len:489 (-) comp32796_c9_seq1:157-1623(-)
MESNPFNLKRLNDTDLLLSDSGLFAKGYNPCSLNNYKLLKQQLKVPCTGSGSCSEPSKYLNTFNWTMLDLSSDALSYVFAGTSKQGVTLANAVGGYFGFGEFSEMDEPYVQEPVRVNTGYTRPLNGTEEIPQGLERSFVLNGGETYMETELHLIEHTTTEEKDACGDCAFKLTFVNTSTDNCTGVTYATDTTFTMYAHKVVLGGLPPHTLARITAKLEPDERQNITKVVNSTYGMEYSKYFVSFNRTEWETRVKPLISDDAVKDWELGRYTSDNTVQQMFAWYPGTQGYTNEQVMSQADCDVIVFQFYADNPIVSSLTIPRPHLKTFDPANKGQEHEIPSGSLQIILENFATMLNVSIIHLPTPLRSQYRYHSIKDPQTRTDAWHQWTPGTPIYEKFEEALQPASGVPLFLAGEPFSTAQGWGEGAAQTAEYMLQERMGIKPPSWLTQTEYCDLMPFYKSPRKQTYTTPQQCYVWVDGETDGVAVDCE